MKRSIVTVAVSRVSALGVAGAFVLGTVVFTIPPASAGGKRCFGHRATIVGTAGPDIIHGTPGRDVILGPGGDDRIYGGKGPDIICGNAGNDGIAGQRGYDHIAGDLGNDVLEGNRGQGSHTRRERRRRHQRRTDSS